MYFQREAPVGVPSTAKLFLPLCVSLFDGCLDCDMALVLLLDGHVQATSPVSPSTPTVYVYSSPIGGAPEVELGSAVALRVRNELSLGNLRGLDVLLSAAMAIHFIHSNFTHLSTH